jgi:uncharacterized protein YndB with AHSA1/START domain
MATTAISPDQNVVTAEIFIAAPPERVFQAITDPTQTPQWWGQQGMYRITAYKGDVRVGGKWSSVGMGADGKSFRVDGEYLEIDPPRRLVYTWISSYMGPQTTTVHWELEPREVHAFEHRGPGKVGSGTLVRLRHQGFRGAPQAALGHSQGWVRVLGWMQAFVEEGKTVDTRPPASAA